MYSFGQTISKTNLKTKGMWFGVAALLVAILGFNLFFSSEAYGSKEEQVVVVQPGDTLWSIAAEYYKGENIQEAIYHIKKANDLKSANLQIGTELRLPTF